MSRMIRPQPSLISFACLVLVFTTITGCEQRVVRSGWQSYGALPAESVDQSRPTRDSRPPVKVESAADMVWAINLETFEGPSHAAEAERRRRELASASGMNEGLWVSEEGWRSRLYFGQYKEPDTRQAERDLEAWRQLRRVGAVSVAPPLMMPTTLPGSAPQHNLAFVAPPAHYTLQIGHYDEQFGKDFRRAAEQAAAALREDGVEAYYYHGPATSSVTIGAFPEDAVQGVIGPDGFVRTRITDPRILELQKRFPAYFVNGAEQNITVRGTTTSATPAKVTSSLAPIPR